MSFSFLYKWALVLGLLLGHVVTVFAQDANMDRAKHVYELFVADQGDSIHALLNKNLQEKLSPEIFKDMFKQSEKQFGKLQAKGEWKQESAEGITLYYRDLKFERYSLRFLLSFDADGSMNTIRLMPVPAASTAKPVAYNKEKMQERDITVGADDFKLPGTLTLPVGKKKAPVVILVQVPVRRIVMKLLVRINLSVIWLGDWRNVALQRFVMINVRRYMVQRVCRKVGISIMIQKV